jgi:phosphohistidine phosphatase
MKLIYLVRHAKSSWNSKTISDFNRDLDEIGHEEAKKMATFLAQKYPTIDFLLHSAATRTTVTAQYFTEALSIPHDCISSKQTLYNASEREILSHLRMLDDDIEHLLIVGHNPSISDFSGALFDKEFLFEEVPPCGIVVIESNSRQWSSVNFDNMTIKAHFFPDMISAH